MFADVVESVRHVLVEPLKGAKRVRERIRNACALAESKFNGLVLERRGDGVVVKFSSVDDAILFGVEFQASNESLLDQENESVHFRIGIHVGALPIDGLSIYGITTSFAARLCSLAQAGEVLLSEAAYDHVRSPLVCDFEDRGYCYFKHFPEPERVFRARKVGTVRVLPEGEKGEPTPNVKIAVAPFQTITQEPSYATAGMLLAESVTHYLSRSKSFDVVAWQSVKLLTAADIDARAHKALGCQYVVSGSVATLGTKLVAHAAIRRCVDDELLSTLRVVGGIEDLLQADCDTAKQICEETVRSVFKKSIEQVSKHVLPSLPSYELLMGAIGLMHNSTRERFERGREAFDHLLDRHPRMHVVRPWVAKWYVLKTTRGITDNRERDALFALEQANRTLDAKPDDSFAMAVRGFVHCHLLKRPQEGVSDLDRAVVCNPNDALAHLYGATVLGAVGRYTTAWEYAKRAISLSPLDPQQYYFLCLAASAAFFADETESAEALARESLRLNTLHSSTYRTLTLALVRQGRLSEARHVCEKLQALEPQLTVTSYLKTSIQPEAVRRELAQLYEAAGLRKT
jgi:TolB-like protein/Tfp pilus assembly protein PilF